ncbi:hypothetical protein [Kordiimonas lacus]|uniref:Uncharacterized protein n=1 Tax=Kordiimonas lacus TaxID=637679 RepID=A0A1G7ADU4_9PROT|nr:hypothetical protein [Kordiimonas lacus]SDE12930.1 hypothetical protein SAMN04488071_2190 [Kordiimonas lacus]
MRVCALLLLFMQWVFAGFAPAETTDNGIPEDYVQDAYMLGPSIYRGLRFQIREMDAAALIDLLSKNDRRIIASRPEHLSDPGKLTIEKRMPDGSFQHVSTILPPIIEKPRLLPHQVYSRPGLEQAIKELIDFGIEAPTEPDVAASLADIFLAGPEEGVEIAKALRAGRIKHPYGNTYAMEWMVDIGRFSKDYSDIGTTIAWLLDPSFRNLRVKEQAPLPPRNGELGFANTFLALLQSQKDVKRRDLLYCRLKQNRNHPVPERREELMFITLSRMVEWGDTYPKKDFAAISDQMGFFRRLTVSISYRNDETPVMAADLSIGEIDINQCPFLNTYSFR